MTRLVVAFLRGVAALMIVSLGAGCASGQRSVLASRFIREGTPSVDLGGPRPSATASARPAPLAGAVPSTDLSRVSPSASFVESGDPKLRQALAFLITSPNAERHVAVALEYKRLGIVDKAFHYLTRSLEKNGPDARVYETLARMWRDSKAPELGLADAYRAVYYAPKSAAARNTLGTLLYELRRPTEAAAQFRAAAALEPNAWYAFANLCHVDLAAGRTKDAIAACGRAEKLRDLVRP